MSTMKKSKVMTKPASQKKVSFDEYYKAIYGKRWKKLKSAMCTPPVKVAMWNRCCKLNMEEITEGLRSVPSPTLRLFAAPLPAAAQEATVVEGGDAVVTHAPPPASSSLQLLDQPPHDEAGVAAYYLLDWASTMIVEQLQVDAFDKVLDLCAAPGGKSIAISQFLSPQGELTSNEAKPDRNARLKRNMHEYIAINTCSWHVTQRDATTWHSPEYFDRVLVDAPCSSERHVVLQPGAEHDWDAQVPVQLSKTQGALLMRCFEALKVGGRAVYSTCAITPVENDDVVKFALSKTRCHIELEETKLPLGEKTECGWIVLPDVSEGWGPMYCATFKKVGLLRPQSDDDDEDEEEEEEVTK